MENLQWVVLNTVTGVTDAEFYADETSARAAVNEWKERGQWFVLARVVEHGSDQEIKRDL